MDKRRIFGVLALAVITAVTAGVASPQMAAQRQESAEYQAPLEAAPVAQVEGETLSPNGRFQVRTAGKSEMYVSGYVVPEFLQYYCRADQISWALQDALTNDAKRKELVERFTALHESLKADTPSLVAEVLESRALRRW